MDFPSLVGAVEWQDFRDAFLKKKPIVRPVSGEPGRFEPLWADWQLEALSRFTSAPYDHERFRLICRGKQVPPGAYSDRLGEFREEAFRQLCSGGASVALGNLESYSNLALAVTRRLEAEFRCPVQVNLYITPGASQGLGAHVDPHDVLILQIQGEKSWDIYGLQAEEGAAKLGDGEGANPAREGAFERLTLKRGGWLYLPKGTRHEVRNLGGVPSVHFTFGFHPLTWGEVFQRGLTRARVATPVLNEALLPDVEVAHETADVEARLGAIMPWINAREQAAAYYAGFPALGVPPPSEHVVSLAHLNTTGPATPFRWREEAVFSGNGVGFAEIALPYRRFPVSLKSECGERLKRMIQLGTFTAADVDEKEPESSLLLCRFLAGVGVLEVGP